MGNQALDAFTKRMLAKKQRQNAIFMQEVEGELAELSKPVPTPGQDIADHLGKSGPIYTTPGWERQYAEQNWDDETRRIRTPAADFESVEFIRAVSLNDQAKLREIADRPHNRAFHRADLATGIGAAGTGGGLVPVGFASAVQQIISETARLRQLCNIVVGGEFAVKVPQQTTKTVAAVHAEAADMGTGVTEPVY